MNKNNLEGLNINDFNLITKGLRLEVFKTSFGHALKSRPKNSKSAHFTASQYSPEQVRSFHSRT